MSNGDGADKDGDLGVQTVAAGKPKRVRTGCLTCRERHLKCDEGLPECNNCKKSSRTCKRGVRLNFIDIWAEQPPTLLTSFGTDKWRVHFMDESREIASEYKGGLAKYRRLEVDDEPVQPLQQAAQHQQQQQQQHSQPQYQQQPQHQHLEHQQYQHQHQVQHQQHQPQHQHQQPHHQQHQHAPPHMPQDQSHVMSQYDFSMSSAPPPPVPAHQDLPPAQSMMSGAAFPDMSQHVEMASLFATQPKQPDSGTGYLPPPPNSGSTSHSHYGSSGASVTALTPVSSLGLASNDMAREGEKKEYLDNQEETLFMQVFVEEVGLWMDSMDPLKHFSRLLPFHSLSEPMLHNAFLACGARHLTLVNPAYTEEKALHYYDTATSYLLKNLQNPNRDTVVCATTAVILNVYEIMSERALQRMNHIAGARALIKECGWNARAQGIGSACFWLNVGLEVLSCLHFNWQVAWDPDEWYVDMDFSREIQNGREEVWTHRMLYIVAKICNFRATIPRFQEADPRDEQIRKQQRYEEWARLKGMADAWNEGIPRTMHPLAYLYPYQTSSKSNFPEVWLVKRSTIVARLFYHTAQLLISQTNPYASVEQGDMADMQRRHSQMICGIAAHVKDRGVASVAIRSLHHAAEVLTERREQDEVMQIFDKINRETGWRIGFVYQDLKEKWGWNEEPSSQQFSQTHTAAIQAKAAQEAQQRQIQDQADAVQRSLSRQHSLPSLDFAQQQMPQASIPLPPPPPAAPKPTPAQHKRPPPGILNPMYAKADFNLPQHPYQKYYVAPNTFGTTQSSIGGQMYYTF